MNARPASFRTLPLLDRWCKRFSPADRPLDNVAVICVQHLLETTGSLIEAMFRLGLQPQQTYVLGKIYSTNPGVQVRLKALGVHVSDSEPMSDCGSYSDTLERDVERLWKRFLTGAASRRPRAVIVLDDGGYAISKAPLASLS